MLEGIDVIEAERRTGHRLCNHPAAAPVEDDHSGATARLPLELFGGATLWARSEEA